MAKAGIIRKVLDSKHIGAEPDLTGSYERINLAQAYNWYNYAFDSEKAKEFAIHYLKEIKFSKDKIRKLNSVNNALFINSVGWNARILSLGGTLPEDIKERMFKKIDQMIETVSDEVEDSTPELKPTISIQQRTKEKTDNIIGEFELELDKALLNGAYTFNAYNQFKAINAKPVTCQAVADYYIPLFNEYIDALSGQDKDLNEAYSKVPKKELMRRFKLVEMIVNDAETFGKNMKKIRVPRKPKVKSSVQLVTKVKYKVSDDKYKINSIRPVDIIGAEQLWVFNTKTRMLGVYYANGPAGFSIKGTTIQNFDEKLSIAKRSRKPESDLTAVAQATKANLKKIMGNIKAKSNNLTGRINSDTVLLRITK